MAEYGREQRNQLSRAVANSETGSKQLKEFVDNRTSAFIQLKSLQIIQMMMPRKSLTAQYHDEEEAGDSISLYSPNIKEHQDAIQHYRNAIQLRRREAERHDGMDVPHRVAIETLQDKISAREGIIKRLTTSTTTSGTSKKGPPPPPPPPPSSSPAEFIGTANQASWLTGISAWQPRKY